MTQFEIRTVDLPSFVNQIHRQAIGFDQMFEKLSTLTNSKDNYPPHNLVKIDDNNFAIELAVAGFDENEITIELDKNVLTITGEQIKVKDAEYLHKGISSRDFTRSFPLAEHIQVGVAKVKNGILSVALERIVPEDKKPKTIAITYE